MPGLKDKVAFFELVPSVARKKLSKTATVLKLLSAQKRYS